GAIARRHGDPTDPLSSASSRAQLWLDLPDARRCAASLNHTRDRSPFPGSLLDREGLRGQSLPLESIRLHSLGLREVLVRAWRHVYASLSPARCRSLPLPRRRQTSVTRTLQR